MNYGTDLLLTTSRDTAVTANGDLALKSGADCVIQDLITRLETPLGTLFYDIDFGSRLYEFLHLPVDGLLLKEVEQEIETRLEQEPRIEYGTIKASAQTGATPEYVTATARFQLIKDDTIYNLVIEIGDSVVKVLEDYRV